VIGDTAYDAGATLVCLRKATKFAAWMAQAGRSPYGLLTDWREAKPCLEAAEACPPSARPAFVVIYCELPRCLERATAWAGARAPGATPVRILADLEHLKFCLNGVVSNLGISKAPRGHPNLAPYGGRSPGQPGVGLSPHQSLTVHTAVATEDEDHLLEARYERMRKERDSMWLQCWTGTPPRSGAHEQWAPELQARGVMPPHFQQAPMQPVVAGCVYVGAACAEASAAQGCGSLEMAMIERQIEHLLMETTADAGDGQQQIEAMLVSAMPDHYDD